MAKTNVPQKAIDLVKEVGLDPGDVFWDCHGTFCLKHSAVEAIAASQGIVFDEPVMLMQDYQNGYVALLVTGTDKSGRKDWSIGEASPKNCKSAYSYAFAMKRARDRVSLSLIGLSGFVYSESEADEFKEPAAKAESGEQHECAPTLIAKVETAIAQSTTKEQLDNIRKLYEARIKEGKLREEDRGHLDSLVTKRQDAIA